MPFQEKCLDPNPSTLDGKKIKQQLAHNMVYETYWQKIIIKYLTEQDPIKKDKVLEEVVAVKYRRCLFESILSDPKCVGIRCYFTETTKDDLTLVMVGYDEKGKDLTVTNKSNSIIMEGDHDTRDISLQTYIAEIGGGDKFRDFYDPNNPPIPQASGRALNTSSINDFPNSQKINDFKGVENSDDEFNKGMSELFHRITKENSPKLNL